MRGLRRLWAQLRGLGQARRREREWAEEMGAHLEAAIADHLRSGIGREEARRRALADLGGLQQAREACREAWTWRWLDARAADVRYAGGQMRRHPGFAIAVVGILGLAIAANTQIFTIAQALVLRPYPYRRPNRLVQVWDDFGRPGNTGPVSYPDFRDWRRWNHSFSGMSVLSGVTFSLATTAAPVPIRGEMVSTGLFRMLGARPLLGRTFRAGENRPGMDGGTDPIILSYGFWQSQFGGSRAVVGRVIRLDSRAYTVIGIMPRGFVCPPGGPDMVWVTTAVLWENSGRPIATRRGYSFLQTIARFRPGVTLAATGKDMDRVAARMRRAHPKGDEYTGALVTPWQRAATAGARPVVEILLALGGLLLLAAGASVGGLWLSRAAARRRETGIRAAMGAGRGRLAAQVITEAMVLALLGAGLGLLLTAGSDRALSAAMDLSGFYALRLGWAAVGFAVGAAVIAAILIAVAPAIFAARGGVLAALKSGGAQSGRGPGEGRARRVLVAAEVAVATVLLISAALLARSLLAIEHVRLNFNPHGVLTFGLSAPDHYPHARTAQLFESLEAKLRHFPGVVAVSSGTGGPLVGGQDRTAVNDVNGKSLGADDIGVETVIVTPGYFRTLQIPLLHGRRLTRGDNATAPLDLVANQAAAWLFFRDSDPVGEALDPQVTTVTGGSQHLWRVVGVVANAKEHTLTGRRPHAILYLPLAQAVTGAQWVFVRARSNPLALVPAIRAAAHTVDPTQALFDLHRLDYYYDQAFSSQRQMAEAALAFAGLALLLTCLGLYAVVAYAVAQRRREIGLRLALGAQRQAAVALVWRQGLWLSGIGLAVGVLGAWFASRLLTSQLFHVHAGKPVTFLAAVAVLAAVAAGACCLPARRAARVDPAESLRCE